MGFLRVSLAIMGFTLDLWDEINSKFAPENGWLGRRSGFILGLTANFQG